MSCLVRTARRNARTRVNSGKSQTPEIDGRTKHPATCENNGLQTTPKPLGTGGHGGHVFLCSLRCLLFKNAEDILPNATLTHTGPMAWAATAETETSAGVGWSDLVRRSVRRTVAQDCERQRRSRSAPNVGAQRGTTSRTLASSTRPTGSSEQASPAHGVSAPNLVRDSPR